LESIRGREKADVPPCHPPCRIRPGPGPRLFGGERGLDLARPVGKRVKEPQATVENDRAKNSRVNAKVSFVMERT
jgi:hypothetical protein